MAGGAALAASVLLVPALLLAGHRWRERDPERDRQRRRPPVWSAPGEPVLEVRSLVKVYGGRPFAPPFRALSGVSFTLTPGIVGLLGPNGAGKTTLLRVLTGLLEPTRGKVLYRGAAITPDNLAEYRRRIGFLPQEFNAYPGFTAEQFLDHWALERGLTDPRQRRAEIERLLAAVGLTEHAGRKVRDYSGGMRQRVGIARALLAAPPILIVDEPTTGLDVESRNRFRQILLEQAGERVIVFSTHIASDIEAAASRILLLHREAPLRRHARGAERPGCRPGVQRPGPRRRSPRLRAPLPGDLPGARARRDPGAGDRPAGPAARRRARRAEPRGGLPRRDRPCRRLIGAAGG